MNSKFLMSVLALLLSLSLVGCGGGGSSSGSTETTTSTAGSTTTTTVASTTTTTTAGTLGSYIAAVTSVPTPTYSGDALALYQDINAVRSATGAGLLAQNTHLDTSATNHANYLLQNPTQMTAAYPGPHEEVSGTPGFTGGWPSDRDTAAGYTGGFGTEILVEFPWCGTGNACVVNVQSCFSGWENSAFHRAGMLSFSVEVGVAVAQNATSAVCVVEFGVPKTDVGSYWVGQVPTAATVFPYAGQTGVETTWEPDTEGPNIAPDLGSQQTGIPISIEFLNTAIAQAIPATAAYSLTINTFSLTQQGSATPVSARIIAEAGTTAGPGITLFAPGNGAGLNDGLNAYLLPLAPLLPNTTYNAVFKGTVSGVAVNLNWSYTTGAN